MCKLTSTLDYTGLPVAGYCDRSRGGSSSRGGSLGDSCTTCYDHTLPRKRCKSLFNIQGHNFSNLNFTVTANLKARIRRYPVLFNDF